MKNKFHFFYILLFVVNSIHAQTAQQVWNSIKDTTHPQIATAFQNDFNLPYKQPLADYGWEDGVEISRDGLHLYALYCPMDILSFTNFFTNNQQLPICDLFGNMNYMRTYANTYGMDMATNYFGCDSFAYNIDILYSHRNSINDDFSAWQLSGIARAGLIEGGPSALFSETNPNSVDLFMFTGNGDTWMINNTAANPTGINNAVRLPSPINPDSNEFNADNAFLARISDDTIILVYERYTNPDNRTFMYTTSNNNGIAWNAPQAITTVTNSLGHIEHPSLHKDENNIWWLYFSIDYTSIVRVQQTISGNWNSWGTPETILTKGNALAIGEPTVTQNGDISFSLGYMNQAINDSTDVYDLDPWILPRKTTTGITVQNKKENLQMNISPNPFANELQIDFSVPENGIVNLQIINAVGILQQQLLINQQVNSGNYTIKFNSAELSAGVYICKLSIGDKLSTKIIIKQ
jgi:hypothetical protein